MEKAKDYKKYLKTLKKITKPKGMSDLTKSRVGQFTVAGRLKNLLKKRRGGAMLKNPGKADLDKDGKLSGYEKKRGMAIEKSMSGKPMKAAAGALALGLGGDKLRKKIKGKKMPLGLGAAALLAKKKKDILGAKRGKFAKKLDPRSEFGEYNKMRDLFDRQRKMQQRKKDMEKDKQKISEKKKGIAVKSGGMMKYNKGGGADTGKIGELKSKLAVAGDKFKKFKREFKRKRPKLQAPERGPMKPLKAKTGDLMESPRRKLGPKARAVLESMSSKNPMKSDRLREGVKARRRKMFTDALKKIGSAGRKFTPGGAGSEIARRIGQRISKKMGGGMMNKPMGYKSGTSVMARGCKLGRKKPTKIM